VRDVALTLRQTGYNLLSLSRNPRALVFTIVMPVVLLVMFASIFAHSGSADGTTHFQGEEIDTDAYFAAGIIAYSIMMASFSTMAIALTNQRESGLLKRFRGTPVPAWAFIASQVLRSIVVVTAMTLALLLIAHFAYDVDVSSAGVAEIAVFVVLGTAAMCALGVAVTAITTTPDSAGTIAPFSTVLLSFISGVFVPVDQLPKSLVELGHFFPLSHLAEGLQGAFDQGPVHLSGSNVATLAIWGAAGLIVAARRFRWQPHGSGE
jgi:ABC-2 type transport system permease protein